VTDSSLAGLLAVFDVRRVEPHCFVGDSDAGDRDIIDGSQLLSQSIVAATATVTGKTVRRANGVFCRPVRAGEPIEFDVAVLQDGRTFATAVVTASQRSRPCATVSVLLDVPGPDLVRHPVQPPDTSAADATPYDMPLTGRELRLAGLSDPNDPAEVGPPRISAWLRYDEVPERDDLARALLAHFTGHLSISATMRAHAGIGTAMSHSSLSTAVMAIDISFHEPVTWDGWLLYDHDSTSVSAGMSYVRGQIRDETGRLLASFSQDGMIREFDVASGAMSIAEAARL
jgi:acyl-CoA thioesterase-2